MASAYLNDTYYEYTLPVNPNVDELKYVFYGQARGQGFEYVGTVTIYRNDIYIYIIQKSYVANKMVSPFYFGPYNVTSQY